MVPWLGSRRKPSHVNPIPHYRVDHYRMKIGELARRASGISKRFASTSACCVLLLARLQDYRSYGNRDLQHVVFVK